MGLDIIIIIIVNIIRQVGVWRHFRANQPTKSLEIIPERTPASNCFVDRSAALPVQRQRDLRVNTVNSPYSMSHFTWYQKPTLFVALLWSSFSTTNDRCLPGYVFVPVPPPMPLEATLSLMISDKVSPRRCVAWQAPPFHGGAEVVVAASGDDDLVGGLSSRRSLHNSAQTEFSVYRTHRGVSKNPELPPPWKGFTCSAAPWELVLSTVFPGRIA